MQLFANALKAWKIDEAWLKTAKKLSIGKELITFDIFDTCITRDVESPFDIFCRVEKQLLEQRIEAKGFASAREKAEQHARNVVYEKSGGTEISFNDIYTYIGSFIQLDKNHIELAQKIELEIEAASLFPVPDILQFTQYLTKNKFKYSFVSDMYFPEDFIKKIIIQAGYKNFQDIIVSCTFKKTKAVGDIWTIEKLANKNILHIGDNFKSDVTLPKQYKSIDTLFYDRAKTEIRTGCELSPSVLPFSEQSRLLEIELRADPNYKNIKDIQRKRMQIIGESFGVLMLGTFTKWLQRRVKENNIKHLYFLARDGWLMQEAWKILDGDVKKNCSFSYLYVSRKTLNLANAYLYNVTNKDNSDSLDFLSSFVRTISVEDVFALLNIKNEHFIKRAKEFFGKNLSKICAKENQQRLRHFFSQNSDYLYPAFHDNYIDIINYFKQEGLFDKENIAIVDLGWNGTMQMNISHICRSINPDFSCLGFYFGLWKTASGKRYLAGHMESAFFNEFDEENTFLHRTQGVDHVEELHVPSDGSTSGYKSVNDKYQPICPATPQELNQYENYIAPFQKATLQALQIFNKTGTFKLLSEQDFTIENVIAAYFQLFISPTNAEIYTLIHIAHGATFDHTMSTTTEFNFPKNIKELEEIIQLFGWRVGIFRYLQLINKNRHDNKFKISVKDYLNYLTPRQLRLFDKD